MKRIVFTESAGKYVKDSIVTVNDVEADFWIKEGKATAGKPIPSVSDEPVTGPPIKRVRFPEPYKLRDVKGVNDADFEKDDAIHLPATVADMLIKKGVAVAFPIQSVGENKMMKPAMATAK